MAQPLAAEMMDYLRSLEWPGNIRELSNVIARYVLIGPDSMIYPMDDPAKRQGTAGSLTRTETMSR